VKRQKKNKGNGKPLGEKIKQSFSPGLYVIDMRPNQDPLDPDGPGWVDITPKPGTWNSPNWTPPGLGKDNE
jgi:hypothetical protein